MIQEKLKPEFLIKHVKLMIENNVDMDTVSKITGKTIKELNEINRL